MKYQKGAFAGLVVVLIIIVVAVASTSLYERNARRAEFADQVISQGRWTTPDSVTELKKAIAENERRIDRYVQASAQNATYWKLLSVRLQQRGLHGDALDALERAISLSPEDPMLHYYTGISAGTMAKSYYLTAERSPDLGAPGRQEHRNQYFSIAESAFRRAIELDGNYLRPRYSLGVLYVFDLDRPEEAIPHLQKYLEISRNDVDTMFVLARAYYMLRMFQESLELYDRIIILTGDEKKRIDAQNNRQIIMGHLYG